MIKKAFSLTLGLAIVLGLTVGCGGKKTIKPTQSDTAAEKKSMANDGNMENYLVRSGDSLWRIAGKSSVMGDPFRWPLLFKSNRDHIEDPDIIEVRQDLSYKEEYSRAEILDAVEKAKETPPYVPHAKPRRVLPVKY